MGRREVGRRQENKEGGKEGGRREGGREEGGRVTNRSHNTSTLLLIEKLPLKYNHSHFSCTHSHACQLPRMKTNSSHREYQTPQVVSTN